MMFPALIALHGSTIKESVAQRLKIKE